MTLTWDKSSQEEKTPSAPVTPEHHHWKSLEQPSALDVTLRDPGVVWLVAAKTVEHLNS